MIETQLIRLKLIELKLIEKVNRIKIQFKLI